MADSVHFIPSWERERGGVWGTNSDEGTQTLVLYVYYNHFTPTTLSPLSLQYNEHKRIAFVPHVSKKDTHRASLWCPARLVFFTLLTERKWLYAQYTMSNQEVLKVFSRKRHMTVSSLWGFKKKFLSHIYLP